MIDRMHVELVVASFDDPIVTGLHAERATEPTARLGADAGGPPSAEPGTIFLVARDPSGPLGCVGVHWIGTDAAEVGGLVVRAEHAGVARALLTAAEDLARGRGCRIARVRAADLRDATLYESSGYRRVPAYGRHPGRLEKALRGAELPSGPGAEALRPAAGAGGRALLDRPPWLRRGAHRP